MVALPKCGDPNCDGECSLQIPEAWANPIEMPGYKLYQHRVVRTALGANKEPVEVVEVLAHDVSYYQAVKIASPGDAEYPRFDLDIQCWGGKEWRFTSWEPVVVSR